MLIRAATNSHSESILLTAVILFLRSLSQGNPRPLCLQISCYNEGCHDTWKRSAVYVSFSVTNMSFVDPWAATKIGYGLAQVHSKSMDTLSTMTVKSDLLHVYYHEIQGCHDCSCCSIFRPTNFTNSYDGKLTQGISKQWHQLNNKNPKPNLLYERLIHGWYLAA